MHLGSFLVFVHIPYSRFTTVFALLRPDTRREPGIEQGVNAHSSSLFFSR